MLLVIWVCKLYAYQAVYRSLRSLHTYNMYTGTMKTQHAGVSYERLQRGLARVYVAVQEGGRTFTGGRRSI